MSSINGRSANDMVEETTTMQNAAAATGNGTAITLDARAQEIMFTVVGSVAVLTVTIEADYLSAGSFVNAFAEDLLAATGIATTINAISNPTTHRLRFRVPPGATSFRVRVSAFTSGTVTVVGVLRRRRY